MDTSSSTPAVQALALEHRAWPWLRRLLAVLAIGIVAAFVAGRVRSIHWHDVGATLRDYDARLLAIVGTLVAASYLVFGCFDLLGRAYARHRVSARRVLLIGMVVYCFNLNFGGWIGSLGTRYRLYSHQGLKRGSIAGILGMALLTNWLGFTFLAAGVLLAGSLPVDFPGLRAGAAIIGVGLLALGIGYLAACAWSPRRTFHIRGFHVHLPHARLALLQLVLSCANWLLMATMIWSLLEGRAAFAEVLAVLLACSIASVVTHVPGGLGIVEALFVAALGDALGEAQVLGAIVAYRALYYLAPLPLAGAAFAWLEAHARWRR